MNDAIELANSLVSSYVQYANGLKCVVFAVSVAHSQTTAEAYNLVGIPALHLDGDTSSEDRAKALGMFASGEIKVISNCSLFDEGLDIPSIEVVQIAKPTKSLGKYLQMLGRGLRPAKGKEQAISNPGWIVARLESIADFSLKKVAEVMDGELIFKPLSEWDDGSARALQSVKSTIAIKPDGRVQQMEYKFESKLDALHKLGQYHGMWMGFDQLVSGLKAYGIELVRDGDQFLIKQSNG